MRVYGKSLCAQVDVLRGIANSSVDKRHNVSTTNNKKCKAYPEFSLKDANITGSDLHRVKKVIINNFSTIFLFVVESAVRIVRCYQSVGRCSAPNEVRECVIVLDMLDCTPDQH
jgi:hypothetical protein